MADRVRRFAACPAGKGEGWDRWRRRGLALSAAARPSGPEWDRAAAEFVRRMPQDRRADTVRGGRG